jgi:hypothetical protein
MDRVTARRGVGIALVLLPVAVTYLVLARVYTAVPVIDDYQHIFAFALNFQRASTLAGKLGLIFTTQVGPYKLIFDHALVGLQLLVWGRLDFPWLIFLGNLTPLGIFAVLWRNAVGGRRGGGRWVLLLLPVSLLLFGLNYAETLDWAISGLQQPMVILFSLAAIHFLVKAEASGWDLAWACGFGVLASTTYANGMIVWPVGLVFLLLQDRRVGRLVAWGGVFVAMLGVYLYRYQPDAATAHGALAKKAVFFVMFCGSALENMHHRPVPYVSVAIGLVVLAVFGHAVRTRYDRRSAFLFYSTVWVLLTGVVVANARTAMGLELSLSSRYKIYCDLLLVFCYEYLLDRVVVARWGEIPQGLMPQSVSGSNGTAEAMPLQGHADAMAEVHSTAPMTPVQGRRWILAAFVGAAVVFLAGDFAGAKLLKTRRERAEGAMRRYLAAPESASPMFLVEDVLNPSEVMEEEKARRELSEAIRLGIYTPPARLVAEAAGAGKLAVARPEWFAAGVVGADGRKTYPAEALAGAYRATAPWGTILLGDASYVSPFYDPAKRDPCGGAMTPYVSPRRFVGVGRPAVDDERRPQRLVSGSVILGEVCGSAALQAAHLGVDVGPGVVRGLYGGVKANGIYLPSHGRFNPKRGTRLEDVSVLTNDMDGQHSVLIEGEEGAVVDGLWVWAPGGTHGLIVKSAHSVVRDYHCTGAVADCLLVKSDYMTAANGKATDDVFEGIHIHSMNVAGDTGGITFDATWDTVSGIELEDVEEDGLLFGFSGSGSWFHRLKGVRVEGWTARGMAGPCEAFGMRTEVVVARGDCVTTYAGGPVKGPRGVAQVKPELRILWEMVGTWVRLGWRWVMAKG